LYFGGIALDPRWAAIYKNANQKWTLKMEIVSGIGNDEKRECIDSQTFYSIVDIDKIVMMFYRSTLPSHCPEDLP
jgi:hypothetical protein